MPEKYEIKVKPTLPRFPPVGKLSAIEKDGCLGCVRCARRACVYDVYKNREFDVRQMVDTIDHLCKNCFRCVQECKGRLFSRTINPEYLRLGDEYWQPGMIATLWYQAETGKIPVSGAGYRGPFVGPGFDSMWTDMSEIVRPTRDGIHGREYISTNIDMGRKLMHLEFAKDGSLALTPPPLLDIPMPTLLNVLPFGSIGKNVRLAMARAAINTGVPMIIEAKEYFEELAPFNEIIMPQFTSKSFEAHKDLVKKVALCEFIYEDSIVGYAKEAKKLNPEIIVSVKVKLNRESDTIAEELTRNGAEVIHLYADYQGNEWDQTSPRFIKDVIRKVHQRLVDKSIRDEVTIIASGGIGLPEHVAKVMLCGADGVAVDLPLLVALECRICKRCIDGLICPVEIENIDPDWGTQRITNLIGAWHSQLIELMGAMGIREACRLRGETGRAMFFEDMEREFRDAIATKDKS